ncbi:GTPase Era [bacterium AH-315-C07]|nr:GTPase Era [bacterium AH-315-C07]
MEHKAGYVNIIGQPNVGKSTLLNQILGEKLAIISPKAQTTRHRMLGILNDEESQILFSDTPGILTPHHKLHQSMNAFIHTALIDADLLIFMVELNQKIKDEESEILSKINKITTPKFLVINKCDKGTEEDASQTIQTWKTIAEFNETFTISALKGDNTPELVESIRAAIPEHPPYFPKDQLTDKHERFFVGEIIREKILLNFKQEIPYSVEVVIESFKEEEKINKIYATIFVERDSQKPIIIGKKGAAIKKIGIEARKDIEVLLDKHAYLELTVKTKAGWRNNENTLKKFGYK